MKKILCLLSFIVPLLQAQPYAPPKAAEAVRKVTRTYYLGEAQIKVASSYKVGSGLTFFNMHDNENTAVQAVEAILAREGGRLIQFQHTGERNLSFGLNGKTFVVDPNRIYTDVGIRKTLETNSRYDEMAAAEVQHFARDVINDFDLNKGTLIVAVHNNTNENYSIKDYLPGRSMAKDAAQVQYQGGSDADDFFYVTDATFYEQLASAGFNVILQNNATVTDDGSFSVFCGNKRIPYVNVEAEHGKLGQQIKMLELILNKLK